MNPGNPNSNLMVIEDPNKGVFVPELTSHSVKNLNQGLQMIERGNSHRKMAATKGNVFSTRSHAVLEISLEIREIRSKLLLIDLAGSERAAACENRGERMREGANINKSLLALGTCISLLATNKDKFVPYRDSKLTRLLKESLGGNTITVMMACVSPAVSAVE